MHRAPGRGAAARRRLAGHPAARSVRAGAAGARADLRAARAQARRAARRATPRRVHARAGLTEWTVLCYLDLETRASTPSGEPLDRIVDYKVKGTPIGQQKADRDPQASLYLAGRWLEGRPVEEFAFAQIARPGPPAPTDERDAHDHPANARAAARSPRTDRARRVGNRRPLPAFSGRSVRVRSVRVCEPVELPFGVRSSSRLSSLSWLAGSAGKTRLSSRRPSSEGRGLSGDSRVRGFAGGVANRWLASLPTHGCRSPSTWRAYALNWAEWARFLRARGVEPFKSHREQVKGRLHHRDSALKAEASIYLADSMTRLPTSGPLATELVALKKGRDRRHHHHQLRPASRAPVP